MVDCNLCCSPPRYSLHNQVLGLGDLIEAQLVLQLIFQGSIRTHLMVQQAIEYFNEYDSVRSRSIMPTVDKQQPAVKKKTNLSDLPNSSDNIISKSTENSSFTTDKGLMMDSEKASGTKRQQPDCPLNRLAHQPLLSKGGTGHLVYVRRKLETEGSKKTSSSNNVKSCSSPVLSKFKNGETEEAKTEHNETQKCGEASPCDGETTCKIELNDSGNTTTAPVHSPVAPKKPRQHDWKDRYLQLQMFLGYCNQSSQEDYKQSLRSLSVVERSRHAFDLEKRALRLLLQEGKELQQMQILNSVDESLLQQYASPSANVSATKF